MSEPVHLIERGHENSTGHLKYIFLPSAVFALVLILYLVAISIRSDKEEKISVTESNMRVLGETKLDK